MDLPAFGTWWTAFVLETDTALQDAVAVSSQLASLQALLDSQILMAGAKSIEAGAGAADQGLGAVPVETLMKIQDLEHNVSRLENENARLLVREREIRFECQEKVRAMQEQSDRGVPIEQFKALEQSLEDERVHFAKEAGDLREALRRLQADRDEERKQNADEIFSLKMDFDAKLQKALRTSATGGSSGASAGGAVSSADREIFRKKTQLIHTQYQEQIAALTKQVQALQRRGSRS